MDQPFTIAIDRAHRLVSIRFGDAFWDEAIKASFFAASIGAFHSLGCPPGTQRFLVDLRIAVLQSQTIVASLQKLLSNPAAGRIALVASLPLARMQTRRLQVRDGVRMFPDPATAKAWLFADEPTDAAAAAAPRPDGIMTKA